MSETVNESKKLSINMVEVIIGKKKLFLMSIQICMINPLDLGIH